MDKEEALMTEVTDEWIIDEIIWELEEAKLMKRKPMFFVGNDEQKERLKRLFPIAVERLKEESSIHFLLNLGQYI